MPLWGEEAREPCVTSWGVRIRGEVMGPTSCHTWEGTRRPLVSALIQVAGKGKVRAEREAP